MLTTTSICDNIRQHQSTTKGEYLNLKMSFGNYKYNSDQKKTIQTYMTKQQRTGKRKLSTGKTGHATSCCGVIVKTNVNMIIYRCIGNKRIKVLVIFTKHFCRVFSLLMLKKTSSDICIYLENTRFLKIMVVQMQIKVTVQYAVHQPYKSLIYMCIQMKPHLRYWFA